jgi:hypothetical protein
MKSTSSLSFRRVVGRLNRVDLKLRCLERNRRRLFVSDKFRGVPLCGPRASGEALPTPGDRRNSINDVQKIPGLYTTGCSSRQRKVAVCSRIRLSAGPSGNRRVSETPNGAMSSWQNRSRTVRGSAMKLVHLYRLSRDFPIPGND